jgi:hypothetical protein
MHPAAPCCSALAYDWYARFSRLALRVPLSSQCVTVFTNRTTKQMVDIADRRLQNKKPTVRPTLPTIMLTIEDE